MNNIGNNNCPNCGEPSNILRNDCTCTKKGCIKCNGSMENEEFNYCDECWEKEIQRMNEHVKGL